MRIEDVVTGETTPIRPCPQCGQPMEARHNVMMARWEFTCQPCVAKIRGDFRWLKATKHGLFQYGRDVAP